MPAAHPLQAAVRSAQALRAFRPHRQVADLAGIGIRPAVDPAVHNDPAADACRERHVKQRAKTPCPRRTPPRRARPRWRRCPSRPAARVRSPPRPAARNPATRPRASRAPRAWRRSPPARRSRCRSGRAEPPVATPAAISRICASIQSRPPSRSVERDSRFAIRSPSNTATVNFVPPMSIASVLTAALPPLRALRSAKPCPCPFS